MSDLGYEASICLLNYGKWGWLGKVVDQATYSFLPALTFPSRYFQLCPYYYLDTVVVPLYHQFLVIVRISPDVIGSCSLSVL